MAKTNNHLVIMAGGVGSRFWPMSTAEKPKQFIDVLGVGKTLIQLTVERFGDLVAPENVWVVTNQKYAPLVEEQLPNIPKTNILCEPSVETPLHVLPTLVGASNPTTPKPILLSPQVIILSWIPLNSSE